MLAQPVVGTVDAARALQRTGSPSLESTTSTEPGDAGAGSGDQPDPGTTAPETEKSSAPLALAALGAVIVMAAVLAFTYRRLRPGD